MENLQYEFGKIKEAFERVRQDVVGLKIEIARIRLENNSLKEKPGKKTKVKTVTKTVVKKIQTNQKNPKHNIVGNKKTKKVHYSICSYAKKIDKKSLVKFKTVKDALKEGYHRCNCIFHN